MRIQWSVLTQLRKISLAVLAAGTLCACGVKFNLSSLASVENEITHAPLGVSAFSIDEISPTSQDPLSLVYGTFTGNPVEYCMLENNTNVTSCVWTLGSPPGTFSTTTTEGDVTLSLWLKDAEGTISTRTDSNLVAVDRVAPQVASFSITNSSPTNTTTYGLAYGAITGTYNSYCIRENNTSISGCTWIVGTVPGATVVSSTQGAKTLSLWLRDPAGNVSTRRDTSAVILDTTLPTITLTSLTGGQTIAGGGSTNITWTASDTNPSATPIRIEVSSDSGATWSVLANNEANDGTYTWSPVPAVNSTDYQVRVTYTDAAGNSATSASGSNFTINTSAVVVAVTAPNGGEILRGGASYDIEWDVSNLPVGASTADLHYSLDGGSTWTAIATGVANTASNTYTWNPLPSVNENDVRVRVTVTDSLTNVTSDMSDSNFTIDSTAPTLASVTVTNNTPTTVRNYVIEYGTITDTYTHYCILENSTAVGGCSWVAGTLPHLYVVDAVEEAKVLSVWLRDAAGNVSTRRDSNSVTYAKNLQLTPATATASLSNTTTKLIAGRTGSAWLTGDDGHVYIFGGYYDNVGGSSGTNSFADVVAYNPATEQWKAKAPMHERRAHFEVVKLSDGRIWAGGGLRWNSGSYAYLKSTEIYDPVTDTWTRRRDMPADRYRYVAGRFTHADGTDRIAVIGGKQDLSTTVNTIYVYNPLNDSWTSGPTMSSSRSDGVAVETPDGKFVVAGGLNGTPLKTWGLYDPAAGTWTAGANNAASNHERPKAVYVPGSATGWAYDVVVIFGGGVGTGMNANNAVDMLRLDTGTWSARATMSSSVGDPPIVPMGGDKFLRVGGATGGNNATTVEEYDVSANSWTARAALPEGRGFHVATLLSSGKVLAAGGTASGYLESTPKNYLYTPGSPGSWAETGHFVYRADSYASVKLADGKILRCGGYSTATSSLIRDCFRFDPEVNGWDTVGKMNTARADFPLILLPNGKVLAPGGKTNYSTNATTNTAELYDPTTGTWTTTGSFTGSRRFHKGVVLQDGDTVLIAGGNDGHTGGGTYRKNAQKYSISAGTWSAAGTMSNNHGNHGMVLLSDGRVFVNGGFNGSVATTSTEIYDPASNTWSDAAASSAGHGYPIVSHYLNGGTERVYVVTGFSTNGGSVTNLTEIYDVATDTWSTGTNMPSPRWLGGFVTTEDGYIYAFGGSLNKVTGGTPTSSVYRYDIANNTWSTALTALTTAPEHELAYLSAHLLDDGRVLIPGVGGGVRTSEIYSFVSTHTVTPRYGDLNLSLSLFSGPGTLYPKARLFVPHSADFSARGGAGGVARIVLTDGDGATDETDITIP